MLGIKKSNMKVPWYIGIPLLAIATWNAAFWSCEQAYRALNPSSGLETAVVQPVQTGEANETNESNVLAEPNDANELETKVNYDSLIRGLMNHEDIRKSVYSDNGGLAIGIGFNLGKKGAKKRIEALGLDYQAVCNGKQELTFEQIYTLMAEDTESAMADAKKYIGEKWTTLHPDAKEIIINMSYNLGKTRLLQFRRLRGALIKEDYVKASQEMEKSKWYNQTGSRARELTSKMKNINSEN